MEKENPLYLAPEVHFQAGEDNLAACSKHLYKLESMAVLFCTQGQAQLFLDLKEYRITTNTVIFLFPGCIIRLNEASEDFRDQSYLGRFFKRSEGLSPAAYRNRFIQKRIISPAT